VISDLKKDLAILPILRDDIRQLESEKKQLNEQLSIERSNCRFLDAEKVRLLKLTEELELSLKDARNARIESLSKEAERHKLSEKELQLKYSDEVAKLNSALNSLRNEYNDLEEQLKLKDIQLQQYTALQSKCKSLEEELTAKHTELSRLSSLHAEQTVTVEQVQVH
jgi:chromosome segregation ATPase